MNLRRLIAECRSAPIVYLCLLSTAARRQSLTFTTTRTKIQQATGIKLSNVTRSMQALQAERAIKYKVQTKQDEKGKTTFRYYKISMGKSAERVLLLFNSSLRKSTFSVPKAENSSEGKGTETVPTLLERGKPAVLASTPTEPKRHFTLEDLKPNGAGGAHV